MKRYIAIGLMLCSVLLASWALWTLHSATQVTTSQSSTAQTIQVTVLSTSIQQGLYIIHFSARNTTDQEQLLSPNDFSVTPSVQPLTSTIVNEYILKPHELYTANAVFYVPAVSSIKFSYKNAVWNLPV